MMNTKTDLRKTLDNSVFRRTRRLFILSMLFPLLLSACSLLKVRGSGNIITETRDLHDFDRVVFSGVGELSVTQGEEESLTITADDNLMSYIESDVRGNTLYLQHKEVISPSQPLEFRLSVIEITSLEVNGIATAETGEIVTERLDIQVNGLSTLSMDALQSQTLAIWLNGSVEVEVTGAGEVVDQEIEINGSSSYYAPALHSQNVNITINGPGNVTVWAADYLNVFVSGVGNVYYYGNPQVTQKGSGNVSLTSLGNP